jgi:outer membrane protein OmpA-like peptidoglycan-associated protein
MNSISRLRWVGRLRSFRIVLATSGVLLVLGGSSLAQTVRTFDDAPSVEQLRSIMVPEARSGASRTIVIQRPGSGASQSGVQPASTETMGVSHPSTVTVNAPSPQVTQPTPEPSVPSAPEAVAEAGAVAFHINFAFNSAVLPDSAHVMIDRIAQLMKETPQLKLRVEGHTDAVGSAQYNLSLSEGRALSVAQYLAAQGIARGRLILVGKGKTEPLTHDPFEPANRRVQFVRIG